jgi:hypothetical protein
MTPTNLPEETAVTPRSTIRRLSGRAAAVAAAFGLVLASAAPSFAAPSLTVDATSGLKDGQTLTISGTGFAANLKSIAIGQCVQGYTGPADCNTSGGAQFKNADASGNVASFTIVVKEKFGNHDCAKEVCLIAGAPLPTGNTAAVVKANTYEVPIYFGDAGPAAPATTAPAAPAATTAPAAPVATTMATSALAMTSTATVTGAVTPTGSNGAIGFLLLGAGALIAGGAGVMLTQSRRVRPGGER